MLRDSQNLSRIASWPPEPPKECFAAPRTSQELLRGPQNLPKNASRPPEPPKECFAAPQNLPRLASRPPELSGIASRRIALADCNWQADFSKTQAVSAKNFQHLAEFALLHLPSKTFALLILLRGRNTSPLCARAAKLKHRGRIEAT